MGKLTLAYLFLLALFGGCADTPIVEMPITSNFPLAERKIVVRKSHPGKLTYKRGSELDVYDLSDEKMRQDLDDHGFLCHVGERSFYVYCRYTYVESCFLFFCGKKKKTIEYRDAIKEHDFLVSGGTKCRVVTSPPPR
jgi:hypothetical protein